MGEFGQQSFIGGMNLLLDDTRLSNNSRWSYNQSLSNNQYRVAINARNRYDVIDSIPSSVIDVSVPNGIKQQMVTFGNYIIVFVAGLAYYRLYNISVWINIPGFLMSTTASRFWTVAVPLATTNYGRITIPVTAGSFYGGSQSVNPANNPILQVQNISAAFGGNTPGLLVQDGINQPQFIYLDSNGAPTVRTTQTFAQWNAVYGTSPSNYGVLLTDAREYVPIGTSMAYTGDGILYITALDGVQIYRSISGRPLDFVINVNPDGSKGGDATTTSYSVGVGPITCLRPLSTGGLFVSALNANFSVTLNRQPNAPMLFGEYTFIRTYLFEGTALSDRAIIDSLGDTRFISPYGVRSFNAIQQTQNEGRNTPFTSTIQGAFQGLSQSSSAVAAILFNNYELYAVNTTFGPAIAVFDTINSDWVSLDIAQTGGVLIKAFAKIELGIQALYAITTDDRVIQLYASTSDDIPAVRLAAMCPQDPKKEQKVINFRCVMTNITQNYSVTANLFINNRFNATQTQSFNYTTPPTGYSGPNIGPDVNSQTNNILFSFPNSGQGWKAFIVLTWTGGGSLVFVSMSTEDVTPMQSLMTQAVVNQ
jgi:hypothetical protein